MSDSDRKNSRFAEAVKYMDELRRRAVERDTVRVPLGPCKMHYRDVLDDDTVQWVPSEELYPRTLVLRRSRFQIYDPETDGRTWPWHFSAEVWPLGGVIGREEDDTDRPGRRRVVVRTGVRPELVTLLMRQRASPVPGFGERPWVEWEQATLDRITSIAIPAFLMVVRKCGPANFIRRPSVAEAFGLFEWEGDQITKDLRSGQKVGEWVVPRAG